MPGALTRFLLLAGAVTVASASPGTAGVVNGVPALAAPIDDVPTEHVGRFKALAEAGPTGPNPWD